MLQPLLLVCLPNICFPPSFLSNGELVLLREAKYSDKKEFDFPSYPFNWKWLMQDGLAMGIQQTSTGRVSRNAIFFVEKRQTQLAGRLALCSPLLLLRAQIGQLPRKPWKANATEDGAVDFRRNLNLGWFPSCLWCLFLDIKFIWETKCYCWSPVGGFLLNLAKRTFIGLIGFKIFEAVKISSLSVWRR